jgi:hypothetical protein
LYAKDNLISCQLTVPAPSIADTPLLKAARLYLDDAQKFLNTRRNIDEDKIMHIAREAKTLQDAIGRFDQVGASQSKRQLDDLLRPIDGFVKYVSDKEAERQQALVRRFTLASDKAEKGIYFITDFLRKNLGYPKTETLVSLKARLESSLRPNSVTALSIDAAENAGEALDAFLSSNSLSAEYGRTIEVYVNPQVPPGTPPTVDALITEKRGLLWLDQTRT